MPVWGSVYFQDGVSFIMEHLLYFHDYSMMVMVGVMVVVGYFLLDASLGIFYNRGIHEGQKLEGLWTVFPGMLLMMLVFPSLKVLYYMEETDDSDISIKVLGHQWFWSYEYLGLAGKEMDSYMLNDAKIRLLEVDNWLVVPFGVGIKMVVSSMDVIHSWTVPSLGVKTDAVPGRLNQLYLWFNRPGTYIGQCSEICGANHSFMPISMLVASGNIYIKNIM
uniref:Cytochrome c oxidase subunit 2 n=1 Tax=Harpactocrates apennicola TaxID=1110479 RepID=A0A516IMB9_9ARAC|nr:cytochrome c oxidase subunit II [Harpactocrates apennicola]QDP17919.1 cytochrome c oxidase subunit 2 [Harpactocrates apennicola]